MPIFRGSSDRGPESLLAAVPLFAGCSKAELAAIAPLVEERTFVAGSVLTREGERGDECFVIVSGVAEATAGGTLLNPVRAGGVVGEMSLIDRAPRSATVTAITNLSVLVLSGQNFWKLIDTAPSVRRKVLISLAVRIRSTTPDGDDLPE